jgi:hypothetical protein
MHGLLDVERGGRHTDRQTPPLGPTEGEQIAQEGGGVTRQHSLFDILLSFQKSKESLKLNIVSHLPKWVVTSFKGL